MKSDDEGLNDPFMMTEHTAEEIADCDQGCAVGSEDKEFDDTKSLAWQRGWAEA
jgi:hypothetical protein